MIKLTFELGVKKTIIVEPFGPSTAIQCVSGSFSSLRKPEPITVDEVSTGAKVAANPKVCSIGRSDTSAILIPQAASIPCTSCLGSLGSKPGSGIGSFVLGEVSLVALGAVLAPAVFPREAAVGWGAGVGVARGRDRSTAGC